jgi:hypothetical protein
MMLKRSMYIFWLEFASIFPHVLLALAIQDRPEHSRGAVKIRVQSGLAEQCFWWFPIRKAFSSHVHSARLFLPISSEGLLFTSK